MDMVTGTTETTEMAITMSVCYGCRKSLASSPLIASVSGHHSWHIQCLRCCECKEILFEDKTCFLKNGEIYCRSDYEKLMRKRLVIKCTKCDRWIGPSDWVRKAGSNVYHLACFACDLCHRQLSTGEQFTIETLSGNETQSPNQQQLLCKLHFAINKEGGDPNDSSSSESGSLSSCSNMKPSKTKRVRTTFTEEQLQVLQANFQIDSNPDGQDLERIATLTGLSKRVTQVWFQNSRARQKKYMNKTRGGSSNGSQCINGGVSGGQSINGTRSGSTSSLNNGWTDPGSEMASNSNSSWIMTANHCQSEED